MKPHDYTPTEMLVESIKKKPRFSPQYEKVEELPALSICLNSHIFKKNISIEALAELSGSNRATLYKILKNEMKPSRNNILRLALALELSFSETQYLLKCGNLSALSASRNRDVIIIDGIVHKTSIDEINEVLLKNNLMDIYSKG